MTSLRARELDGAGEEVVLDHPAGRVVGVVQEHHPGAGGDVGRDRLQVGLEAQLREQRHRHRLGSRQERAGGVDRVAGVAREGDVAGVEERQVDVRDRLLGAHRRDDHRRRVEVDAEPRGVEAGDRLPEALTAPVGRVLVGAGSAACRCMASTTSDGVGVSGSPIPSEMTSTPAAFLAAIFCSIWAKRYGGSRRSRSAPTVRALSQVLQRVDELRGQLAPVELLGRTGHRHLQVVADGDLQVAARAGARSRGSRGPPSRTPATAAAHAPVPQARVSPTPRSHTRIVSSDGPSARTNSTLVRSREARRPPRSPGPGPHDVVGRRVLDDRVRVAHGHLGQLDGRAVHPQLLAPLAGREARLPHAHRDAAVVERPHPARGPRP